MKTEINFQWRFLKGRQERKKDRKSDVIFPKHKHDIRLFSCDQHIPGKHSEYKRKAINMHLQLDVMGGSEQRIYPWQTLATGRPQLDVADRKK